ncbi:thermonuclease family protein [Thiosulfativibrio zosterae]|uniref:TNase-like domain-containing protein n=1 Tax=Thiosulfativibrio zosterae TaxID=2675053 RepID=A0A6F8PN60_9GAMM|nr:thermonuclease family protein [Thiosulfativibrio zosterae]BBP43526.1 hypothetical protein THMIRHAT_12720 [Thiosulfativibrio zosterae]
MNVFSPIIMITLALFCGVSLVQAETLTGKVISVTDGDTIKLLVKEGDHQTQVKIRLAEIDAPEKNQPWGQKSKQALSDLIFGKIITAEVQTTDRYGRRVADLFKGESWINGTMVRSGHAWVYTKYSKDPQIRGLEQQAKAERLGLWGLPEPERIPPWEWRHNKKSSSATGTTSSSSPIKNYPTQSSVQSQSRKCEGKRTCGQMTSCSEAYFYLNQCGVGSLDRDRDGIPCEKICK